MEIEKKVTPDIFMLQEVAINQTLLEMNISGEKKKEKQVKGKKKSDAIPEEFVQDINTQYLVASSMGCGPPCNVTDINCVFWVAATVAMFTCWGNLMVIHLPVNHTTLFNIVEFSLHIVFMDLVPNYATGWLLHKNDFLRKHQHKWEHTATKEGKLTTIFCITTMYGIWTLFWMLIWGFAVACSHGKVNCWHWESAMWIASFGYSIVGLFIRLVFYWARSKPGIFTRRGRFKRTFHNMANFYWAHFNVNEWDDPKVFGAQTPFWDVLFGSCPYDIPYSTPIPFVDFFVYGPEVFNKSAVMSVRTCKSWDRKQVMWHRAWVFTIALMVGMLPFLA